MAAQCRCRASRAQVNCSTVPLSKFQCWANRQRLVRCWPMQIGGRGR
jgi:hypothetical protein